MRLRSVTGFILALFAGWGVLPGAPHSFGLGLVANAQPAVAWGERVAFEGPIVGLKVLDADGNVVAERPFDAAQPFVDLPFSPALPTLAVAASDPTTEEAFFTPLTAAESAAYVERGEVEVSLNSGATITLEPYGAVLSGQVHALASVQGPCERADGGAEGFFNYLGDSISAPFITLETLGVRLTDDASLCHATFDIGAQDTADALTKLEAVLSRFPAYTALLGDAGFVLDKDSLSSLDQGGRGLKSIDPTCDQIKRWLDPIGDNGYSLVDMTQLVTDIGASGAAVTGQGVSVVVIGGGIGPNDDVRCRDAQGLILRGHDTHVRDIIRAIAPDVSFQAFKVCNAQGACSSAEIVRALLQTLVLAQQRPQTIVNMSLGGPLPDKPSFALLKVLGERFGVPAIVSGGNGPFAPAHYPASYSRGVAPASAPSLINVVPVAATGLKQDADGAGNPGYLIAGFNTRANAILFAPGVNLCPDAALGFRCDLAQPYPDDLGLTGSSYAAPVVTGLAALFTEAKGALPTRLGRCLQNNAATDPLTGVSYAAFGSAPCP